MTITKICSRCKEEKSVDKFNHRALATDGYASHCKKCESARKKQRLAERTQEQKDKQRERHQESYQKNKEHVKAKGKQSYQKNRDKALANRREYRLKNPEKIKATRAKYIAKNRDVINQKKIEYVKANPEKVKTRKAIYQRTHPDVCNASRHRYRTRKSKAGGQYTSQQWQELCEHYGQICLCCRKKRKLTADHIIPVSKGGTSDINNIQPLCKPCNSKKGDRVIDFRPDNKKVFYVQLEFPAIS